MHTHPNFLQIQNDLAHILHHAGDRRELVQDTRHPHIRDCRTLKRREQNPAKSIAQSRAESSFEGLALNTTVRRGERRLIKIQPTRTNQRPPIRYHQLLLHRNLP
jgi:hypothetical protein